MHWGNLEKFLYIIWSKYCAEVHKLICTDWFKCKECFYSYGKYGSYPHGSMCHTNVHCSWWWLLNIKHYSRFSWQNSQQFCCSKGFIHMLEGRELNGNVPCCRESWIENARKVGYKILLHVASRAHLPPIWWPSWDAYI